MQQRVISGYKVKGTRLARGRMDGSGRAEFAGHGHARQVIIASAGLREKTQTASPERACRDEARDARLMLMSETNAANVRKREERYNFNIHPGWVRVRDVRLRCDNTGDELKRSLRLSP